MSKALKKIWYFFRPFEYAKCVDCEFDGKTCNVYCKPPLGICIR